MTLGPVERQDSVLFGQLRWFTRLRWAAGLVVAAGGLIDWQWVGWFPQAPYVMAVGGVILAYNVLFRVLIRRVTVSEQRHRVLLAMAWMQILLDLACLTLLTVWTGGAHSPLLGFYVFHMVIASLLLPNLSAYVGAAAAGVMLAAGLWFGGDWPRDRHEVLILVGWLMMLLIAGYLASNITLSLGRHRRRVLRQRRRIRAMSGELRRHNQAMVQQEKMAAMGQLAAGVAHEITNPLASIDSLLQLLKRNPERQRPEALDRMAEQVDRINQTVRQLTDFAHPGEARWERVSVNQVLGRALQMVRFDHRLRKVDLHVSRELPAGAGWVEAQPHALEQVLVNLMLNALDAVAEQTKPRIDIRVSRGEAGCSIEVVDNGHGIDPAHLNRIFEPFFTTKPVGKGTGLGLAVSYGIVRTHGGRIEAASDGHGARFTVTLPEAPTVS